MEKKRARGNFLLLIAAMIWGSAFVAQSKGMEFIGPLTFNAVRCFVGVLALLPCVFIFTRHKGIGDIKGTLIGGVLCGLALFCAMALQQVGMQYTSVGKAGFLTAMYILLVPVIRAIMGKKQEFTVWISVGIAIIGLFLLCTNMSFDINIGDVLLLMCAGMFSVHVLLVDHFVEYHDGVRLSCIQFFVSGVLSIPFMFFEGPTVTEITAAWLPILYAGVLSSGVAYTFQIIGQKDTNPTVAALIMSLESVFAVIAGWIVLKQGLVARELVGCLLLILAIVLVQIPIKTKTKTT